MLLAYLLVLLTPLKPVEEICKDAERIQGEWALVMVFTRGAKQDIPDDPIPMCIGPDRIRTIGKEDAWSYQLGREGRLRTIELIPANGPLKGKTLRGIYQLEGNVLWVCLIPDPDAPRPTEMTSEGKHRVLILTRVVRLWWMPSIELPVP
jgi:uncharacterized protein (TIGR03067 family)